MIAISPALSRFVAPDRAAHIYTIRERRRTRVAFAKACVTNLQLDAWRAEARAAVDALEAELARDEARLVAFEAALPTAEAAVAAETAAHVAHAHARAAHGGGSLDRRVALKLRDDLEVTEQAARIASRLRAAAVARCAGILPQDPNLGELPCREIAEKVATFVTNRRFQPSQSLPAIDPAAWGRWLDTTEDDWIFVPLHAAALIEQARRAHDARPPVVSPNGLLLSREPVVLPVDDFVEKLAELKSARAAHMRAKVEHARRALDSATAAVSAAEGRQ